MRSAFPPEAAIPYAALSYVCPGNAVPPNSNASWGRFNVKGGAQDLIPSTSPFSCTSARQLGSWDTSPFVHIAFASSKMTATIKLCRLVTYFQHAGTVGACSSSLQEYSVWSYCRKLTASGSPVHGLRGRRSAQNRYMPCLRVSSGPCCNNPRCTR